MDVDVLIIGGGVVGLATAAESAKQGFATLLVERHASFGQETSSRNSEVIHSGIYYPTGSLKARLCVAGNASLYRECARLGVWHNNCGKLVVAVTDEEVPELERILARGRANGVDGLALLGPEEAAEIEPHIRCRKALRVPSTGIVDSHELMKAYLNEARSGGGDTAFNTEFRSASRIDGGFALTFQEAAGGSVTITARGVINAAGLGADQVAAGFGIDTRAAGYTLYPNRGHYYRVASSKAKLVNGLVYPVPLARLTGTGVHITIDRAGEVKLGPDAEYLDASVPPADWYKFDDSKADRFYEAVVRYFPALERSDLTPDQVGVRPKVQAPGDEIRDFIIVNETTRGLPGLVDLIGIESPGLTCSHEIAKESIRLIARTLA
jgi:L-2-hydroxyglutarate oxidase LhgO